MRRPDKPDFGGLSAGVLVCLALTPLAWILCLGGQIAASGTVSVLHLGMAAMCCLALFGLRNWGRWLCLIYNVLMAAALIYQVYNLSSGAALAMAQGMAFVMASLVLFWPPVAQAFRKVRVKA